jgi:hypothetical protein
MVARWAPKRNARRVRKMGAQMKNRSTTKTSTQGSTRLKTSWRMDKNKFWLGGRLFNMAPPRLGAPMQCKARPQDGRPNATQDTSASWAPQRNARHVCKLGAPMDVHKLGAPTHVRNANARHVRTSASCAPQRNARHICKMVAQTQNSSATKMSTQGRTRLKDELEDG